MINFLRSVIADLEKLNTGQDHAMPAREAPAESRRMHARASSVNMTLLAKGIFLVY
jgi:hypothetical protein